MSTSVSTYSDFRFASSFFSKTAEITPDIATSDNVFQENRIEGLKDQFIQQFRELASNPDKYYPLISTAFGPNINRDMAVSLRRSALQGDVSWLPEVQAAGHSTLDAGNRQSYGAFDANRNVIELNSQILNDIPLSQKILIQEVGHALNSILNVANPSKAIGQVFETLLTNVPLSSITSVANNSNSVSQSSNASSNSGSATNQIGNAPGNQAANPTTTEILNKYQVAEDTMVDWRPKLGPFTGISIPFIDSVRMTKTEAGLLDELGSKKGLLGLKQFSDIRDSAYDQADKFFPREDSKGNPVAGAEDGHNDAFRHIFWNARMTKDFGEDFAISFATAHEGVPGNPADKEAMDLYNNELGRRIAVENPGASNEELAKLVFEAINKGEAVVIDRNNDLVFSNQESVGATGSADDLPRTGGQQVPQWAGSN